MAYYFKLLRGIHAEGTGPKDDVYKAGDCFESASDLSRLNMKGMTPKFQILQALPESTSSQETATVDGYTEDELKSLKINELVQICEDEEIDLEGVPKRKKELISKILESTSG